MEENVAKGVKEDLEWLIDKFKLERMVYLFATGISIVLLLFAAVLLIIRQDADIQILGLLFGSTGIIGFSISRLLRMFDQALGFLAKERE